MIFKKCKQNELQYITIIYGQLIYCTDSKKCYYDNEELERIDITTCVIYLTNDEDRFNIYEPLINKLYIIFDIEKVYTYKNNKWDIVESSSEIDETILALDELVPSVLSHGDKMLAPRTLASNVFLKNGDRLSAVIDDSKILTVIKTKAVYVEATQDNQTMFPIPFPKENYDFLRGDSMSIILRGNLIGSERYHINNGNLILDKTVTPLMNNEIILFIFYYRVIYDLNENVVLSTKNLENFCVTTEKLSPDIVISANNIAETLKRIFYTKEEREKLNGIDYNATCYHHPETHPADMIVTDPERRFISDEQIEYYNNKANAKDVYTTEETDSRIDEMVDRIVGGSPEMLDTLYELAEALGNDPNFAATISKELASKATVKQYEQLKEVVDGKVNMKDYVHSTIYTTPNKTETKEGTLYSTRLDDETFKEYIDGMTVTFKIAETNDDKCFLSINLLEKKPILSQDQFELIQGELKAGSIYTLKYNGTTGNFILQGKGGVTVKNASQPEYEVDLDEKITRGDMVDIINDKLRKSVPRIDIKNSIQLNETNFYCDGEINTFNLYHNKFAMIWRDGVLLKGKVVTITKDGYVDIDKNTKSPILISLNCTEFNTCQISDTKLLISYSTDTNILNTVIVNVDINDDLIVKENKYTRQEETAITNITNVALKDNRAIIAWEAAKDTRTLLIEVIEDQINIISSRNNTRYPLDNHVLLSDKQLLFAKCNGDRIAYWVMHIFDADFSNSTLNNSFIKLESVLSNLIITKIDEINGIFSWIDNEKNIYKQDFSVDFNAGVTVQEPKIIEYEDDSEIVKKQTCYKDNYYINIFNNNTKYPYINDDYKERIRLEVSDIQSANEYKTVDISNNILSNSNTFSICNITDEIYILTYSDKRKGETNKYLNILLFNIRKVPHAISLNNGQSGDIIKVCKW